MSVSEDVIEAAKIDGCTGTQSIIHISIPLMSASFVQCLFLTITRCFMVYDVNFSLTNGDPYGESALAAMHVFNTAFTNKDYGTGQAEALILFVICAVVGGLQVYDLINSAFEKSTLAGWCWSGGISFALLLVIVSIFRELKSVWKLKNTYECRLSYENILRNGNAKDAVSLCKKIFSDLAPSSKANLDSFLKKVKPNFSVEDVFNIYERDVLSPLDKKAKDIVVKRSRETGVVVALSPIAWLDMAFSLARSLRMVREIAEVYGYHCGLWGRFELYRKIIRNVVFIGIADLTTDAITDAVGAKTFAKLSAAVGQGLAAGIYSTRLGYMTIKAIRPLPISRDKLTLANLRKDMITGALNVLNADVKSDK